MGDPPCANFLQRQIFQQYCLKSTIRYTKVSTNLSYRRMWILINLLPYRFNCIFTPYWFWRSRPVLIFNRFSSISELSSPSSACYLSQNESVVCPHRAVALQKTESLIFFLCFHIFRFSSDVTSSECLWRHDGRLFWGLMALWDSISAYIGPSPKEREKEERKDRWE